MRISDWSSDVCSSDLVGPDDHRPAIGADPHALARFQRDRGRGRLDEGCGVQAYGAGDRAHGAVFKRHPAVGADRRLGLARHIIAEGTEPFRRSEEHTSELQSLMRNSYAVFCLKKKTKTENQTNKATTRAQIR